MKTKMMLIGALMAVIAAFAVSAFAGIVSYDKSIDYSQYIQRDHYLDAEIWTNNDEYYEGDKITISFRTNKDCFVAIYNIDTRGQVNLIYPTEPGDASHIRGGKIYQLPDQYDNYELNVQGPAGTEYLQIVASNDPFPLPPWFNGSGIVCNDDPNDFLNYINASYFGCDHDCVRALDMTSFQVQEWHDYYFRPVYHYDYPDWSLCGSVYIDYPFGSTIYIDGIYWGIAPLFIPRVYFGYHYITIYDWDGYCWEDRIDVVRYKSIILDKAIIRTHPGVKSRYREVERSRFLDPAKNGYPDYQKEIRVKETYKAVSKRDLDNFSNKTRTVYKEKPAYDNGGYRGERDAYKAHQSARDYNNSSGRSRSDGWKVEKMKGSNRETGKYESQKSERKSGAAVDKRSSDNKNVEVKSRPATKQAPSPSRQKDNSGNSKKRR